LREIERRLADKESRESMIDEILAIRDEIAAEMDFFTDEERREVMRLLEVRVFVNGSARRFELMTCPPCGIDEREAA
jgi:hypothetical protein